LAGGPLAFGGDAAAAPGSPSWVAAHPTLDVVYAAMEGEGTVRAFRRSGETTLEPLGEPVRAGEIVCHAAVAPDGSALVADCWGDGTVAWMPLAADGGLGASRAAEAARDPYAEIGMSTDDARTSRAHSAAFLPDGRVATTDLGFDLVRIWRQTSAGLRPDHEVVLPRGCGPRHMMAHPSGHLYVVTEFSGEVFILAPDASGRWTLRGGVPASPAASPTDTGAELARSRDGEFLYAGLRGSNTIATLRVRGEGERLEQVALVESGVDWPRHHVVVRDTLLVAGQRSDSVASLALDERTGVPGRVRHTVEAPTPSCLLPVRG
ncbi:MAG: beta-propeller fold lactonase family protein, partial [Microbacterium sp.]|uniref:lactonase family protein n=1 Tax=Microbacterium sp. TaxID=51671 RepID=UPI0039E718FA